MACYEEDTGSVAQRRAVFRGDVESCAARARRDALAKAAALVHARDVWRAAQQSVEAAQQAVDAVDVARKTAASAQESADAAQVSADAAQEDLRRADASRISRAALNALHTKANDAQARATAAQQRADVASRKHDEATAMHRDATKQYDAATAQRSAATEQHGAASIAAAAAEARASALERICRELDDTARTLDSHLSHAPWWPIVGDLAVKSHFLYDAAQRTQLVDPGAEAHGVLRRAPTAASGVSTASSGGPVSRDDAPFLYVLNPPRHGKSLLLDQIASIAVRHGKAALAVSFNGCFPLAQWELESAEAALRAVRLRLVLSAIGFNPKKDAYESHWVHLANEVDLVHDVLAGQPRAVLLVDELTNLTDRLPRGEMAAFWSGMFDLQSADRRFIMTGFNAHPERSAVPSGFAFFVTSLAQCEPSTTRDLGLIFYHCLAGLRIPFPHHLYEICKATPGLVGTLLWVLTKGTGLEFGAGFRGLSSFIPWIETLRADPEKFWACIRRVLVQHDERAMDAAESMQLTVRRGSTRELSPFAVAVVVDRLGVQPTDDVLRLMQHCVSACRLRNKETTRDKRIAALDRELKDKMMRIIEEKKSTPNELSSRDDGDGGLTGNEGKAFEEFTAHAVALRLHRTLARDPNEHRSVSHCEIVTQSEPVAVFFICDFAGLCDVLGEVPYRLFPCGFELLCEPSSPAAPDASAASAASGEMLVRKLDRPKPLPFDIVPPVTNRVDINPVALETFPGAFTNNMIDTAVTARLMPTKRKLPSIGKREQTCAASAAALVEEIAKRANDSREPFICIPTDTDNPICDVVAVLFEPGASPLPVVHVVMIECRDRRSMPVAQCIEKPVKLGNRHTAIPAMARCVREQHKLDIRFHLVIAGRSEASAADMVRALCERGRVVTS